MKKLTSLLLLALFTVSSVTAEIYENLYVVGNACSAGWDPGRALVMTKTADGVFTWTGPLSSTPGDARFKFLIARSWDTSITCQITTPGHTTITSGVEENLFVKTNSGADNSFRVPETAEYTINIDLNTMKMTCTKAGDMNTDTPDLTQLHLVGSATTAGWNSGDALTMIRLQDGVFVWAGNLTADGEFKFLNIKGSWDRTINPMGANVDFVTDNEYHLIYRKLESSPDDYKFKVLTTGLYVVNVNLNTMSVTFSLATPDLNQLFIVGSATAAGWENASALEMTKQADGIFTWTGDLSADGEFKFLNQQGSWNKTINPLDANTNFVVGTEYNLHYRPLESSANDYKFKVTAAGRYTVVANLNTMKVTIQQSTEVSTGKVNDVNFSKRILVSDKSVRILGDRNDMIQSAGIFDITGKCLNFVTNISSTVILNDNLAKGIYIVKTNYNNKEYLQKVIVK